VKYDVIVIGAGPAGLAAALELSDVGKRVLILEKEGLAGGRTASWNDGGMQVESGFHRHIGYYKEMPKVLNKVGVKVDDIVMWENNMDIRVPDEKDTAVFGIAPFYAFLDFFKGHFW
jgi:15-cis-phytoene desaturase